MRSRVLFPLCLTGLLLACASGGTRPPSSEAGSSDSGPVQPCAVNPTPPQADVLVTITASTDGKVHFSSTTVKALPGQTVGFVSQVQQDRCIRVHESSFLEDGSKKNPLLVRACKSETWTLKSGDEPGTRTSLWSCPTSDCSKCTQSTQSEGIRQTVNGTLEVTGRGED
ncbi:hypothetical protein [Corallococcus exiguus]|uniref:Lipoprotein n=1 Tax=Corallococcus exiguus TaxID=83462 RepID=A0A7X5BS50_9BACT|nr:hypothetical protein [Corallococcus exiguus]NBC38897.1 hypothetical protein [Corallococcus exiguus]TNV65287.1 hypothetical protein FH620_10320 [Corallococcus exiguus]